LQIDFNCIAVIDGSMQKVCPVLLGAVGSVEVVARFHHRPLDLCLKVSERPKSGTSRFKVLGSLGQPANTQRETMERGTRRTWEGGVRAACKGGEDNGGRTEGKD